MVLSHKQYNIDTCASGVRISELRSDGWKIDDKYVYQRTKENKHVRVKRYYISRENIIEYLSDIDIQNFLALAERKYGTFD